MQVEVPSWSDKDFFIPYGPGDLAPDPQLQTIRLQDVEVIRLPELNISESNPLFVSAELQQHPVPEVMLDDAGVEMQLTMHSYISNLILSCC